jgi:hypothetical protein
MLFRSDSQRRAVFANMFSRSSGNVWCAQSNEFAKRKGPAISADMLAVLNKYKVAADTNGLDEIFLADIPKAEKLRRLENFCKHQVGASTGYDIDKETRDMYDREHMASIAERYVGGMIDDSDPDFIRYKNRPAFKEKIAELALELSRLGFEERLALAERGAKSAVALDETEIYKVLLASSPEFRTMVKDFIAGKSVDDIKIDLAKQKREEKIVEAKQETKPEVISVKEEEIPRVVEESYDPNLIPVKHYDTVVTSEFTFPEQKPVYRYHMDVVE